MEGREKGVSLPLGPTSRDVRASAVRDRGALEATWLGGGRTREPPNGQLQQLAVSPGPWRGKQLYQWLGGTGPTANSRKELEA